MAPIDTRGPMIRPYDRMMPTDARFLVVGVLIGYVLVTRLRGQPLFAGRVIVLPLVLVVCGGYDFFRHVPQHMASMDLILVVLGALLSLILGAARGATIQLFAKDGCLWQRYRYRTVVLWIGLIVAKVLLGALALRLGAATSNSTSLLLSLGLSLLGEALVVVPRALSTGVPFAQEDD